MNRQMPAAVPVVAIVAALAALAHGAGVQRQSRQPEPERSRNSRAPASITGLVVTTSGERLAEVHVSLQELTNLLWAGARNRETTTAADGSFEFENVARGIYIVNVFAGGRRAQTPACRPGDSLTVRVPSGKLGVLTGRVTDTNGKPAIEAPVHAIRIRDSEGVPSTRLSQPLETLTDDQ